MARHAYQRNQIFPKTKQDNLRADYEGAFVYEPTPDLYSWVASFDYASLYPTIMRQFKISIENFLLKDKNYQPKKNEVKCESGAVFDQTIEPFLSEILTDYYSQRKDAKKVSQKAEKEYAELEKILKERKKSIQKSLS